MHKKWVGYFNGNCCFNTKKCPGQFLYPLMPQFYPSMPPFYPPIPLFCPPILFFFVRFRFLLLITPFFYPQTLKVKRCEKRLMKNARYFIGCMMPDKCVDAWRIPRRRFDTKNFWYKRFLIFDTKNFDIWRAFFFFYPHLFFFFFVFL